jgi:hypothetical protein
VWEKRGGEDEKVGGGEEKGLGLRGLGEDEREVLEEGIEETLG